MEKIKVTNPVVELDGDEMARILWGMIKQKLILPFLDLNIKYFDLSIQNRDATNNEVTNDAAREISLYKVGIKCATITADEARMEEFALKKMWPSPNGTIRNLLDGAIFREPIIIKTVPRLIKGWNIPFIIARHAYGDQYKAAELDIQGEGVVTLTFTPTNGEPQTVIVQKFNQGEQGVAMAMHNKNDSIISFARNCFRTALERKMPLYLSTKNTILTTYDGRFKNIFQDMYESDYKDLFMEAGISYRHELIDNMVAIAIRSSGGFLWACKNYDGDVQSDAAAQGFGSLGLMKSILTTPDGGTVLSEAAHGTVTAHYRRLQKNIESGIPDDTSTNPIASIFAWTGGLRHRAMLDNNQELSIFCDTLEETVISTVEAGNFTRDIAKLVHNNPKPGRSTWLTTKEFIDNVALLVRDKLVVIN